MSNLNDLLVSAQAILDGGFDSRSFLNWTNPALMTLSAIFGPCHHYTEHFKKFTSEKNRFSLLAAKGLLEAAKADLQRRAKSRKLKQ